MSPRRITLNDEGDAAEFEPVWVVVLVDEQSTLVMLRLVRRFRCLQLVGG